MQEESKDVIMVVDDNPENLGMLFTYLDHAGFTVLLVQDGENALKQSKKTPPDIVLLDILMPGMDGFEVCRRLKQDDVTRDIPVIFITALTDTTDKLKGFRAGGVDYITKPFHHEEVTARLTTHLTLRRLQQELKEKNLQLEEKNILLDDKNLQLQAANASKNQFFSILAHDLRSPLTGLSGMISLMSEGIGTFSMTKLKELLKKSQYVCESFTALLENLLTWARLQCDTFECCPQPVDIKTVARVNVALLTPQAEQKQIVLHNDIADSYMVHADFEMANTVVRNLLSNSIKFTQPGGEVTLSVKPETQHLTILVSDTGIGIEAQHLPKLFRIDTKFTRLGTAQERGTGLGLVLCKEFVERNGGRIWVESGQNKGTTFGFSLPILPSKEPHLH
jgi:signal transduction histidine kinase